MKKTMPIGYEDFKEVIEKDLYYVDKTQMIMETNGIAFYKKECLVKAAEPAVL